MVRYVHTPKLVVDREFVLEDPPPRRRSGGVGVDYNEGSYISVETIVTTLRENHPGEWAKVHTGGGTSTQLRKEKYVEEGFETRMVSQGPSRTLYVRWPT